MPRRQKALGAKQIQEARGDWYTVHFERRQRALIIAKDSPTLAALYRHALESLPWPALHVMGADEHPTDELMPGVKAAWPPAEAFFVLRAYRQYWEIDFQLVNPWYWSDAGWMEFQRLWKALPEPVEFVPVGLCTKMPVVPALHRREAVRR